MGFGRGILAGAALAAAFAQEPNFDRRLSVNTILREDVFAGFMANDDARLAAGERNLRRLEAERPEARPTLKAWQGAIALTRAARAHEAGRAGECAARWSEARALFEDAARLGPGNLGVIAAIGGAHLALADRLPGDARAESWQIARRSYRSMWEAQRETLETLPPHLKGELLAGVALSAARTGHTDEAREFARRILDTMPGTPYANAVRRWIDKPEAMTRGSIACQTCHEPGRLAARMADLEAQR